MDNQVPMVVEDKPLSVEQIKSHVGRLQKVMKTCMRDKHHYGVIPGCKKPSLWKPGAARPWW